MFAASGRQVCPRQIKTRPKELSQSTRFARHAMYRCGLYSTVLPFPVMSRLDRFLSAKFAVQNSYYRRLQINRFPKKLIDQPLQSLLASDPQETADQISENEQSAVHNPSARWHDRGSISMGGLVRAAGKSSSLAGLEKKKREPRE